MAALHHIISSGLRGPRWSRWFRWSHATSGSGNPVDPVGPGGPGRWSLFSRGPDGSDSSGGPGTRWSRLTVGYHDPDGLHWVPLERRCQVELSHTAVWSTSIDLEETGPLAWQSHRGPANIGLFNVM